MDDKILWAPWRAEFILAKKEKGCIFCRRLKMKDSMKNLIIYRGEKTFVILNKFPYNSGHTLIVPNRHVGQIENLSEAESREFFELTQKTVIAVKKALKPSSLNLGMNLGSFIFVGTMRFLDVTEHHAFAFSIHTVTRHVIQTQHHVL